MQQQMDHRNDSFKDMPKADIISNLNNSNMKLFRLEGNNSNENGLNQSFKVIVDNSKFIFLNENIDKIDNELVNTIATHVPVAEKFVCELCGKPFLSFSSLNQHKQTHDTERKFHCSLCPKTFKGISGLKQHISGFHYKIKPYTCEICKYSYALKGDMLRCRHSKLKNQFPITKTNT